MPDLAPLDPEDRMLTVREAAARLGLDESTVRKKVRKGELVGCRFGCRALRISEASLVDYRRRCLVAVAGGAAQPAPRRRPVSDAHRQAMAALRDRGLVA